MIHVVFQDADIEALRKSFDLDDSLNGDIRHVKDDYAVGPIQDLFAEEGIERRKQWWREVLADSPYHGKADTGEVDDSKTVLDLLQIMNEDPAERLWIWAAQNKHDVAGYYWLMSQLTALQGRVFILYLNNLPFINEKGHIFYPTNLYEIQPREFLKARKLARVITGSEFEVDPDLWLKLSHQNMGVRTLEGGKILIQHDYDYYDQDLLKFITTDWIKVNKLLNVFFSKSKNTTGDAYLLWRLKKLIADGKLDMQGDPRNMKEFEVKVKE